jgi:WD40 repeat protein
MSTDKLVLKNVFGVSTNSRNCVTILDERNVAYVAGHQVVITNVETKEQSFIFGATHPYNSNKIISITHSPPKQVLAMAESAHPVAGVTFYDSHSYRRRKVLLYNDLGSQTIESCSFSSDGRYFVAQGGAPEWNMVLWSVEKAAKVMGTTKVVTSEEQTVENISICPWDSNVVLALGKGVVKLFRFAEGQMRPMSFNFRRENAQFTCYTWLPIDDRLIIGTAAGDLIMLENFEFRSMIGSGQVPAPALAMVALPSGFVMGSAAGECYIYEKNEEARDHYTLEDQLSVPTDGANILNMVLGSDDNLICVTDDRQIYDTSMHQNQQREQQSSGKYLICPFHGGTPDQSAAITAIAMGQWRRVVATCSADKTVRIWDLQEHRIELSATFADEPHSISMHPTSLFVAVGFLDNIKVLSLHLKELVVAREILVRQCSMVKFSIGGQFIAAACGASISIFETSTGKTVSSLRGHSSKIRSMTWTHRDTRMTTVGSEGTVYTWNTVPGKRRTAEHVGKYAYATGTTITPGEKSYVLNNERLLEEVFLPDNGASDSDAQHDVGITKSCQLKYQGAKLLHDGPRDLLYLGTTAADSPTGVMALLTHPLKPTNDIAFFHIGTVTAMCMSSDGSLLFTGDKEGILCVSVIQDGPGDASLAAGTGLSKFVRNPFEFQDETIVHKQDIDLCRRKISELTTKVDELNLNNDHQLRLKEMDHKNKIKDISSKFGSQLSDERKRYAELMEEKAHIEISSKQQMEELSNDQEQEMTSTKDNYLHKHNQEDTRHLHLVNECTGSHERWNQDNIALVESHQAYIRELTNEYEDKLRLEDAIKKGLQDRKEHMQVDFEQNRDNIEEDCDTEIDDLKTLFEERLKAEEQVGLALMAEHAIVKKNLQILVRDADQRKDDIRRLKEREQRLYDTITYAYMPICLNIYLSPNEK